MNALKLAVIIAAIALTIAGCGQDAPKTNTTDNVNRPAASSTPASTAKPADAVASGKELYALNCMICHRETGKGGKVTIEGKKLDPEDLTSNKMKKHDDAELLKEISDGIPDEGMPAFKDKLKADEIKQIIKHVRVLQAGPPATS